MATQTQPLFAAVVLLAVASASHAATLTAVGVYDRQGGSFEGATNAVDRNASGNPLSSTLITDYLGFKTAVELAFTQNRGGVIDFDSVTVSTPQFGQQGESSHILNFPGGSMILNTPLRATTFGTDTAISLQNSAILRDTALSADVSSGVFNFGTISGFSPTDRLLSFGITYLGRNNTGTVALFATYSDGSTSPVLTSTLGPGANNDTFFGFTAPAGLYLQSVTVSGSGDIKTFDDIGFIFGTPLPAPNPIPLPAASLAGTALLAGGLVRRRR